MNAEVLLRSDQNDDIVQYPIDWYRNADKAFLYPDSIDHQALFLR